MNVIHTHTLEDWLAMVCIAVSGYAAFSAPYFLLVDATVGDFDPRPVLRDLADRLLVEVVRAKGYVRALPVTAAALFMLLNPAAPEGAR